ncbi:hypothetical protein LCGC14_2601200 [marine sediment metagenome]|uniref:Uncharacterized protein n=1 Tax=marine sediment metagenome TaxID=412755 RepID=A0A0F9D1E4_9ZZZZ
MRNFVVSMIVVFLVLCVPWFCVAHADDTLEDAKRRYFQTIEVRKYCSKIRMYESIDGKCKCHEGCTKEEFRAKTRCGERVELECNFRNRVR